MALITLNSVSLAFGAQPLLDHAELSIQANERLFVVGRNGAGKTTLLKLIDGQRVCDEGEVRRRNGLRVAYLPQTLPEAATLSSYDYVAHGLAAIGSLLAGYHAIASADTLTDKDLRRMEQLQSDIEALNGWDYDRRIRNILLRFELDGTESLADLSGGWRRRVALARALVQQPDILLLDEPTNHLDLQSILWLEQTLLNFPGTLVVITHDRRFMDNLATRIVELDRGLLSSFPGNYAEFRQRKDEMLHAEVLENDRFDKRLAQEEVWIRQGIKARRTRNEGRVRALKAMREKFAQRRKQTGQATFAVEGAERSGKRVAEFKQVDYAWDEQPILTQFSWSLMRGDKVALIGANGCGKSTLIKLILGELTATSGTIQHGTGIELAYFDQSRQGIDLSKSVQDNVAEGRVEIDLGGRKRHVISYLQDFLFAPDRARSPASALSGGELNRLMLARIFSKPSNLLILDEPTNDLDMETLDLLEDLLAHYAGTLILVSHDRSFVDDTVTSSLIFEGDAQLTEIVGGYSDWLEYQHVRDRQQPWTQDASYVSTRTAGLGGEGGAAQGKTSGSAKKKRTAKLSFRQQRELDQLPQQLEILEEKMDALQTQVNQADFFRQEPEVTAPVLAQLESIGAEFTRTMTRWEALEALQLSQVSE